ncbi:MAG: hypothetical protein E6R06_28860 [Mycobacterium sp.]|nr:MAG: hypothetical protein E6R06_28860 [Mycobacterium sp.]
MTTRHIYVDETKERGYVMVASTHLGPEVDAVRKELRSLVLRGQNRIHMAKESDSRRKAIIDTVIAAGVTATVYDAGRRYGDDHASRAACLRAIVDDMGTGQPTLLVLEQDDTLVRWDRQQLVELLHASGHRDTARYQHQRAKSELLLTIPDAIAWCWARGGEWRQRVNSVTTIRRI